MLYLWRKKDREIIALLRAWYNSPQFQATPEEDERSRQRVMAVVYATKPIQAEPVSFYTKVRILAKLFIPQNVWRFALQPALVMVLVLGVGTGGWITSVQAASNSLPGDALYSIKIASEKTQVAFASFSQDERVVTGLHMAFAKRRLDEMKQVVNKPNGKKKAANASTAVKGFKKEMTRLHDSLKSVQPETAAEMAKTVQARSSEFATAIFETHNAIVEESPAVANELKEAGRLMERTNYIALGVLVKQHAAGDPLVREKYVAGAVGDQLEKARTEVNEFVKKDGVDRAAKKQVAEVVREAEQLIAERAFDGALERVKAIQEIAKVGEPQGAGADAPQDISFSEAITRVLKNVTSTIIGESR